MNVKEIIGDAAYSEKENLEYTKEKQIKLISKLHPMVSNYIGKKEKNRN